MFRTFKLLGIGLALALMPGCDEAETGPVTVSAIGEPPQLVNPNLIPLEPPSALLLEAVAQGLVRFDAAGEIEPALAQSWIVSDDGLRYTFRLQRTRWAGSERVTADQVVARLRAALSRASRNPLKPVLGAIDEIEGMTDEVLEISLKGPRPNFLQILAQPEMAILLNERGTGPYQIEAAGTPVRLALPTSEDEEEERQPPPDVLLRGERAALAVARFGEGEADLVTGGTLGDLPIARAADTGDRLIFDPVRGLFGLAFLRADGPLADPQVRRAMSMAIDRNNLAAALDVPNITPQVRLVPGGVDELPRPAAPDWAGMAMPMRRELAAATIAGLEDAGPIRVRVSVPDGPGYRIVFAHLRRDWRLIGIEAQRVAPDAPADLKLVDQVAPALLAAWYLRHFTCSANPVCDPLADEALQVARKAMRPAERQAALARADAALTAITPFIPLTPPVRWSLVSPRLTGFQANPFGRHPPSELIAEEF